MGSLSPDNVRERDDENDGAEYSSFATPAVVAAWQSGAVQVKNVKLRDLVANFLWWNILRTS